MAYTRQEIIEKVRKILELAKRTNYEGEAQNAFAMAQKLMAEHNLSELEIQGAAAAAGMKATVTKATVDSFSKGTTWKTDLASVIARNFRCMAYMTNWDYEARMFTSVMFLGRDADVEAATEVYRVAVYTIEKQSKKFRAERREELRARGEYWGKAGSRAANLSWIQGFIWGLKEKFDEMEAELVRQNVKFALVVTLPEEVKQEAIRMGLMMSDEEKAEWERRIKEEAEKNPQLEQKPRRPKKVKVKASEVFDYAAYRRGREKGKEFDPTIHKKLEG